MPYRYLILILFGILSCQRPIPDQSLSQSGFLQIEDSQIHYQSLGEGPAILLLHGGYLDMDMWKPQLDAFQRAGYRVVRYSDLGHGDTQNGPQPITNEQIITHLLDFLKIDQTHLIGLSWGAMRAVDYSLQQPDRVSKMVLVSPGLDGWDYFQDSTAASNNQLRSEAFARQDTVGVIEYFQRNWTDGPHRTAADVPQGVRDRLREIHLTTFRKHWGAAWSTLSQPAARERLTAIETPSLLISGQWDAQDIHSIVQIYQDSLPQVQHIQFPKVAHTLNMEVPEHFNKAVIRFLH